MTDRILRELERKLIENPGDEKLFESLVVAKERAGLELSIYEKIRTGRKVTPKEHLANMRRFSREFITVLEKIGYTIRSTGWITVRNVNEVGTLASKNLEKATEYDEKQRCISARITAAPYSPDPVEQEALDRIADEVLPQEYNGVPVFVSYLPPPESFMETIQ